MPVSTFSSDSSTVRRNSGHGGMITRWNSTRDRVLEDERRMGMNQIMEMDGTGLYERDNWPLVDNLDTADRNISPETVISLGSPDGSALPSPGSPKIEQEVSENAVVRKPEDIGQQPAAYVEDKDVSDMEEVSEDGSDDGTEFLYEDSRGSSPVVPERDVSSRLSTDPDRTSNPAQPASPIANATNSTDRRDRWQSLHAPRGAEQPDVSPIREPGEDHQEVRQTNGLQRHENPEPQEEEDELYTNGDHEQNERRDVATAIPFRQERDEQQPSTPTSPQPNGRITPMNRPGQRSSIHKGTPPSRTPSRRSASITQNIPFDKSKVRYSWQSIEDEEPSRPRIHIIKLVSNTATASAGFPQGEAFGFAISPHGRRLAAYNSARMYVLQTAALPVGISQDFALKRRPLAVELVDEGNALAILVDEHTINIYDLGHHQLRRIRTIRTEYPANCIALAPTGGLVAAGYEGGAEIFSLAPSALPTDRRSIRSQRMDRLVFSDDCSTLLGTTTRINVSFTMLLSVPVFPAAPGGVPTHEELKEAWCTELLIPENIRNSSHAAFMRENRETCNDRVFAWNGLEDTFGVLNVSDMQYGSTDFPVVISPPLSTCGGLGAAIHSCPAVDEHGDTVAMVVNDRTIRLYIVPHRAEDDGTMMEAHSIDHELDEGYGCPFSEIRWVYSSASLPAPLNNQSSVQGRLIVTSPGGVVDTSLDEEPIDDIEGGRIIMFDFDPQFAGQPGQTFSLTLGKSQAQTLEEPSIDVADEVALVRRRTVNQSKSGALSQRPIALGRAATTTLGARGDRQLRAGSPSVRGRGVRTSIYSLQNEQLEDNTALPDVEETSEALDTLEEPYAQNAPRSQASLQRAASNAQRHRFQTLEERNQERVSVDSSGGFLPLPEYTEEPNAPLPSRFRAMAGLDTPAAPPVKKPAIVTNVNGDRLSPASSNPSSAPAAVAENFNSDQAFRAASSSQVQQDRNSSGQSPPSSSGTMQGVSPVSRSDTVNSMSSLPRNLQRAYGNNPPPGVTLAATQFENVSPTVGSNQGRQFPFPPPLQSSSWRANRMPTTETLPEEEPWDAISPLASTDPSSRFGRSQQLTNRYSTSLLNPPGHHSPTRRPSTASSYEYADSTISLPSTPSSRTRRLPPHIQSFQKAAAANASASLFPPSHSADHVPHRAPASNIGSVPHRVTAWHPPAASIASAPISDSARGHARRTSLSNKSAFASTEKAKNLGFFRTGTTKKKKNRPMYGSQFDADGPPPTRGGESIFETKSIFTTFTKRDGKCVLM